MTTSIAGMVRNTKPISWIRAARKAFEAFPERAQAVCLTALTIAAEGGKADVAKPLQGIDSGVFEIALRFRGDAFRVVYAVKIADETWVPSMRFRRSQRRGSRRRNTKWI